MGFFSTIAGAVAGSLANNLLGSSGSSGSGGQQTPGFHTSGVPGEVGNTVYMDSFAESPPAADAAVADTGEAPADGNQASSDEANGWLERSDRFLDRPTGRAVLGAAASAWGDRRTERNTRRRFRYLRDQGLTPWEIAGQGGAGGSVQASGNTLGNGPGQQLQKQQDFAREQAAIQRAHEVNIEKIRSGPAYGRLELDRELQPWKVDQIAMTTENLRVATARADFDLKNRWPLLFATMGPQNMLSAAAYLIHGVDAATVLKGFAPDVPEEERERVRSQLEQAARWLTKYTGASADAYGFVGAAGDALGSFVEGSKGLYQSGVNNLGLPNMER